MRLRSSLGTQRTKPRPSAPRVSSAIVGHVMLATSLAAQAHTGAIHGRIVDGTGRPVADVEALLANTSLHAMSDSTGGFLLVNIPPGRYVLVLRRVGYDRLQFTANVFADDTIDAPMTIRASTTQLDTVVTNARAPVTQEAADFDAARKSGMGMVFDSAEIAQHAGDRVSDLLRYKVTGITYKERGCGGLALAAENGMPLRTGKVGGGVCSAPNACYYQVYVDGMHVYSYGGASAPPDIDRIADISNIHGIEVYGSGARTPAQYNSTGAACGTIVIWLNR